MKKKSAVAEVTKIDFNVTNEELATIRRIVGRAVSIAAEAGSAVDRIELEMDLCATHRNGCPLRLDGLLDAQRFDFVHDVFGIRRHLNRQTGKLEDFFVPRYAQPEARS